MRRTLQIAGLLTLCVALITTLFFSVVAKAAPGVNQTISFQGRLLDTQNNVVPDGYYNVQFKIYQDGSGTAAGNPDGTLVWTETHINNGGNNGVFVKNGYLSVDLGSKTPFGTSVDWNQDTLWLSMNIAGSSTVCTAFGTAPCIADGEMLPMKRLTATPYSLNSAKLQGKSASDFVQNGTTQQTANFNISGTGVANTLQGNTSVIAPLFDRSDAGDLRIGTINASTITLGSVATDQTINIGTSDSNKTVTVGSKFGSSFTTLQGGTLGIRLESKGGIALHNEGSNVDALVMNMDGNVDITMQDNATFNVRNSSGNPVLVVASNDNSVSTTDGTQLRINGTATFNQGINIQGSSTYQTPGGANLSSAVNVVNRTIGAYGTVFAFGLPASSASTARGMLVADGRTTAHQATIGILSPDENQIMGLNYNGSNATGYITNTANSLVLQGGGLDLLTATNSSGFAQVGIGNNATSGYALDVTGGINASDEYSINGVSVLNNSGLNFSGATTSTITSASGQALQLTGDGGVKIGDGVASGEPTLLTVDKSSTTPTASGSAALGSMYYDTTIGKLQCYEADGWGACSSRPDTFVSLSPEYSNAVTNGSGIGTLDSSICSDDLNINDGSSGQPTICDAAETYNFYNWTSAETTTQTKSIFVTYKLPDSFTGFVAGSTALNGRVSNLTNAGTAYQVYKNTSTGLVACGTSQAVSIENTWQKVTASGSADPSTCGFSAGDSIVFKVTLSAANDTTAYASTLGFAFSDN